MTTKWEQEYERTTQESIDAAAAVALEPSPRTWKVSGTNAVTEFNPDGYPVSKRVPPIAVVDSTLHDERTPCLEGASAFCGNRTLPSIRK